jgi:hypothetical protein
MRASIAVPVLIVSSASLGVLGGQAISHGWSIGLIVPLAMVLSAALGWFIACRVD